MIPSHPTKGQPRPQNCIFTAGINGLLSLKRDENFVIKANLLAKY